MASIPSEEPSQAAEEGLPPALIAQAEAAIAGNLQQNGRTLAVRSKSYTRLGRSQDQDANSASGNVRAPLTRYVRSTVYTQYIADFLLPQG
jgi:hypothetical protein